MADNNNGRLTSAMLKQELKDYKTHNDRNIERIESKQDKILDKFNELTISINKFYSLKDEILDIKKCQKEHRNNHMNSRTQFITWAISIFAITVSIFAIFKT